MHQNLLPSYWGLNEGLATRLESKLEENEKPAKLLNHILKIQHWLRARLATLTFYAAYAVCVTIFSTGGKFRPVSILM